MKFEIDFDYEAELVKAEKKRDQLEEEKDRIERELAGINHIIEGLKFLAQNLDGDVPTLDSGEPPADFEDMNFAEKIEKVMAANREPMTRIAIRNALQAQGVTGTTPKHLLISVHTTLARMKEKNQVKTVMTTRGMAFRLPNSLDKFHGKVEEAEKEIAARNAAQATRLAGINPAHIKAIAEASKKK
jgi:hypothetical protein